MNLFVYLQTMPSFLNAIKYLLTNLRNLDRQFCTEAAKIRNEMIEFAAKGPCSLQMGT